MEGANLDTNKLNEQWFLESLKNQIANLTTKQDIAVVQQKIDNMEIMPPYQLGACSKITNLCAVIVDRHGCSR